jgi:hypothetical protein
VAATPVLAEPVVLVEPPVVVLCDAALVEASVVAVVEAPDELDVPVASPDSEGKRFHSGLSFFRQDPLAATSTHAASKTCRPDCTLGV